jgi:flagellar assembly protein FliH
MLKAVFRPNELVALPDKIIIDSPTNYPELSHFRAVEEVEEVEEIEDEYTGPTADDLRREAEMFKLQWEEEKERMISNSREEADMIIQEAQKAAFAEVKRQTDEAQVIRQQAEEDAERIVMEARNKGAELEHEIRQNLEAERKGARDQGREEGRSEGFKDGKAEVDRLIERTQIVLERAQDKRKDILNESEKEIVDLVLLITRKVVKVISENQRDIIVSNVIEALRKVRAKGNIIIRVNLADLKLATEHKQEFIKVMEGASSVQIAEDSTVDPGGCIIETDFGEIDARIASQLAELESKILEISPISSVKDNVPKPVVRTANLAADLHAASSMLKSQEEMEQEEEADEEDHEMTPAANAALTASAALAALTTMAVKGKRKSDQIIAKGAEKAVGNLDRRHGL